MDQGKADSPQAETAVEQRVLAEVQAAEAAKAEETAMEPAVVAKAQEWREEQLE